MKLTESELLLAISEAMRGTGGAVPSGPAGVTSREVAKHLGVPHSRASRELAEAVRAGQLIVERGFRKNLLGDLYSPPVYRPMEEADDQVD